MSDGRRDDEDEKNIRPVAWTRHKFQNCFDRYLASPMLKVDLSRGQNAEIIFQCGRCGEIPRHQARSGGARCKIVYSHPLYCRGGIFVCLPAHIRGEMYLLLRKDPFLKATGMYIHRRCSRVDAAQRSIPFSREIGNPCTLSFEYNVPFSLNQARARRNAHGYKRLSLRLDHRGRLSYFVKSRRISRTYSENFFRAINYRLARP